MLYVCMYVCIHLLIPFYRKHLLEKGALDQQYSVEKHSDGTVTLPVFPSALCHLDPLTLQDSSCEIVQIQVAISHSHVKD